MAADGLHPGKEEDATTIAAKRVLVSGDRMLLERRAADLASRTGVRSARSTARSRSGARATRPPPRPPPASARRWACSDLGIRALDLGDRDTVEAIVALQRASYRIEADLLGARTLPALTETPRQLRRSGEDFLGAFEGERLVGAVSWKRTGPLVDIHRMVVDPERFRRGIAAALLAALDEHEAGVERMVVATGAANPPARRLYERYGFTPVQERVVSGSIAIVIYERRSSPA